jgi:hypothetical protein
MVVLDFYDLAGFSLDVVLVRGDVLLRAKLGAGQDTLWVLLVLPRV